MPFVGEYTHTLDAKNRIFIPTKLRDDLGDHFYITRKMNKSCLAVYSTVEMDRICEQIAQFPDSEVSEIKEFLFSKTIYVTPDSNGRVVLPPNILEYAKIDRNAVIVGAGNHLQIWSDILWAEEEQKRDMISLRAKLASLGL